MVRIKLDRGLVRPQWENTQGQFGLLHGWHEVETALNNRRRERSGREALICRGGTTQGVGEDKIPNCYLSRITCGL